MKRRARSGRRGSVLLAVTVTVMLGALVAVSLMMRVDAQVESTRGTLARGQSRALALSGVQAVMSQIGQARPELMRGGAPVIDAEWTVNLPDAGGVGMWRVLEWPDGSLVQSEAAKIDLNRATQDMLVKALGVLPEEAAKILGAKGRGFASAEQIGAVEGVTAGMLYGRPDDGSIAPEPAAAGNAVKADEDGADDGDGAGEDGSAIKDEGAVGVQTDEPPAGWLALLTTLSFEPNTFVNEQGEEVPRVDVGVGWGENTEGDLAQVMDAQLAVRVAGLMKDKDAPKKMSELLGRLRGGTVPPSEWAEVLGALTVSDDAFLPGMVDVTRAPRGVLAAIPGIPAAAAEKVIEARDRLGPATGEGLGWLLEEKALTEQQFVTASDWLTYRTLQWRVRIMGGIRENAGAGSEPAESRPLRNVVVLEAVIDAAGERPRIAYLRDITYLNLAMEYGMEWEAKVIEKQGAVPRLAEPAPPEPQERPRLRGESGFAGGERRAGRGRSGGLELGGLNFGDAEEERAEPPKEEKPKRVEPRTPVDRRTGRWKAPEGGGASGS